MELRCDGGGLLGEDSFAGNAPGASMSMGFGLTAVGVGGSTSISATCAPAVASLCGSAIAVGRVSGESTVSFVSLLGCGELAPWIPRPAGSVSCAGGIFSSSSEAAGVVPMASSKASCKCTKRLAVFALVGRYAPMPQRSQCHLPTSPPESHLRRRRHAASWHCPCWPNSC
jgi:hypothetical protein